MKNELSEFLKGQRIRKGFSQKQVSDELGYSSAQFISNWERGVSTPPLNAIKSLARLYKVRDSQIFRMIVDETIEKTKDALEQQFKQAQRRSRRN